ncbi:hypothetical protein ScPMuIL_009710 [Solemya velum]
MALFCKAKVETRVMVTARSIKHVLPGQRSKQMVPLKWIRSANLVYTAKPSWRYQYPNACLVQKCQSGHIMPCNVSADAVCISTDADNTGMIVGIVLGSVIVVLASVIVGCICRYRRSLPTLTCCSSSSRQVNREDGMEEKTLQPTAVAGDIILEEKIIEIGAQLIKEWKMFFRHLYRESGLDNADTDIDEMKHEYEKDGIKECIHQLFLCWMRKMGNRVNIETNIDAINLALSKCNRLDLSIERPSYRHDRVVNLVEC